MANSSIDLTSLDFNTLKQNFVTYLQSQDTFKDYNFGASNISTLLDVMSYNTFMNSFYLNMVASEMFLDSAQKYNSVVSHAKELNYVPRSFKSSSANISFTIVTDRISNPFTIPKGTRFIGTNANGSYTFSTTETTTYVSSSNTYSISGLSVSEGVYVNESFTIDTTQPTQTFLLSNPNIDTDSLTVSVYENNSTTPTIFTKSENLFGLNELSNIYFLQGAQSNQYEVVFGDGIFGRVPVNGATVVTNYRVSAGTDADGVNRFNLVSDLTTSNYAQSITASVATTTIPSTKSSNSQSIESIRFEAPRYFATQQRAVTNDDYASLVLSNYTQIEGVNVYGGELLNPKQYGAVALCLKPSGGLITPNYLKGEIINYLTNYIALPNRVIITDPQYIYCSVDTTVQYEPTSTTKSVSLLHSLLTDTIYNFSENNLQLFNKDFRYSKFTAAIDNTDSSITSNDTKIKMIKRISPLLNYASTFVIEFNNPTEQEYRNASIGYSGGDPFYDEPVVTSSSFTYVDSSGVAWNNSFIRDDNYGKLVVYTNIQNAFTVINPSIGSVDYATGLVNITNLTTSSYGNYISIYMAPYNKDILVSRDKILVIDLTDVSINIIPTQK